MLDRGDVLASLPNLFAYHSLFYGGVMMAKYEYKVVDGLDGSLSVPMDSEFYLEYKKGTTVKALEGTLGIMVFTNIKSAKRFVSAVCRGRFSTNSVSIKKVIPLGRKTIPEWISRWTVMDKRLKAFNKIPLEERRDNFLCSQAPLGTVCYPEVIVVD
jgi:hypothetical protein